MGTAFKILGVISAVIIIGSLIVMNSTPAPVDLFFVEGEISVFLIIMVSFLSGFTSCLTLRWLRKVLPHKKKPKRYIDRKKLETDLIDIEEI